VFLNFKNFTVQFFSCVYFFLKLCFKLKFVHFKIK
jgi:hypothetical protein